MKTKLFITSFFILMLSLFSKAQPTKPTEVLYDSQYQGIQATAICPAVDGGYIISGVSNYGNNGLILKVDTGGNVIWNTFFSHYNGLSVYNIVPLDSSYVIAASTNDSAFNYKIGLLLEVNKNGNVLWAKTYKNFSGGIILTSAQPTNDSGLIICGYQSQTNNQTFAAKIGATGIMQWHTLLTASSSGTQAFSIKQLPDSSFVVIGSVTTQPSKPFLASLSKTGSLNWTKMYTLISGGNYSSGNDVIISKGGLILNVNAGNNTALLRTDFLGNQIWSKFYPTASTQNGVPFINQSIPSRVRQSIDGGYYFTINNYNSLFNKTDSTGNLEFAKHLMYNTSVDALQAPDKGFLITGNGPLLAAKLVSNAPSSPQIGLIKVDSAGNTNYCAYGSGINMPTDSFTISSISLTSSTGVTQSNIQLHIQQLVIESVLGCVGITGSVQSYANQINVIFYPNPANDYLIIESSSELGTITIYNSLGQKMTQAHSKETTTRIDISNLPMGIYNVLVDGGYFKLVKQ